MPMPRPVRSAAALAGLLLLLFQAWAPAQAVAAMARAAWWAAEAESMCLHDEDGRERAPDPESHGHHAACPACSVCCTGPAALLAGTGTTPLPQSHGRVRKARITSPTRRRAPGHRPNARAPPSPERRHRFRTTISAGHNAGFRGDHT